ncbi:MAG: hypothetical protein ABJE47_21110 [bacterium]
MTTTSSTQSSRIADLHARVLVLAQRYADRRLSGVESGDLARDVASDVVRMFLNRRNVMLTGALPALVRAAVSATLRYRTSRKRNQHGRRPRRDRTRRLPAREPITRGWDLDAAERDVLLDEALDRISPTGRRVYLAVCADGLTVSACGLALGMPEQAVSFSLRSARRALKDALRELGVVTLREVIPSPQYRAVANTEPDGAADIPHATNEHTRSAA